MEEESTLKLILEKGPREGETLEFKPGSVIRIGRVVRGNTVAVKDAGVSSKHLSIEFISGKWVLTDLDSSNGTVLNDSKLLPMNPSDLSSDDTIKFGEYTVIKVEIELEGQCRLRRNPRRGAKAGELNAVVAVAESRRRKGGAKTNLASVSENCELGLGVCGELGNGVEVVEKNRNQPGRPRRARVLKNEELENVEEMNNVGQIEPKNQNQPGRLKRARVLTNKEPEKVEEVNNAGPIEPKKQNRPGRPGRARILKNGELEKVEEVNNVGPIEPKQGRRVSSRRTQSSMKEENLHSDSMLEKNSVNLGLDGNKRRELESSAPADDVKGKRMRGATRRKRNLEDEPLESVENVFLKEVVMEGLNLQPEGCKEVETTVGVKENLANVLSEGVQVDVPEENEGVEKLNLRREGDEEVASVSGVKEDGVEARDEPDLEKMTLGEWFEYLEVHLPKQIHDMTEEMISNMRHRAEQFHEFMLQQKNEKDEGKLPIG
ncbi:FHA domain-containing protein At4g14490-like [Cornus florida]|uniref:FHA domain-containing protein At4g14490-like n=1 Tax=Cornus florida TaxID=4283 RepID=UPI00289F7C25|nr:FHA domain-containing protein At4g14490-like [Cornus florida]